ncbi:hypothetical protein F4774DRAFT_199295 [Daldinia eschscholtzii]|nr:hypothetical protein F4774DRAFT_199295 [Daldinia eschscholtzii]
MASNTLEIPMPRLRPQLGGVVLLVTLTAAIILYTNVIHQQIYLLNWIKAHDVGWSGGFGLLFDTELLKTSWLPTLLYRSPHHQLAIAASTMDITVSAIVMVLFVVSAFIKKNFWQNWILVGLFVPAFALTSIAFLYNFIEHDITGRLDSYYLYQIASPTEYHPYGAN